MAQQKSKFAEREEEILKFWQKEKIFEKSLAKDSPKGDYVFYDGPPFATGTPHYGHMVASLMKDVIPRYQTMRGKLVKRRWGWDCHGLPIENLIEKELNLKSKQEIEKIGVSRFCESCQLSVLRFAAEWKKTISRFGRWVEMETPYKTMDAEYMESIWWVFKTLWDKKLIYLGYKSMHICPRCETTLSNFEVTQGYKDVIDLSVTAKFELEDEPGIYVLAWTTTPWTLIGNVALAVGAQIEYVKFSVKNYPGISDGIYIASMVDFENYKDEIKKQLAQKKNTAVKILEKFKGQKLTGKKYQPLFDYYQDVAMENRQNLYTIQTADFVSTQEGTGIVHIAPAFGEDDMNLGREKNLPFIQHVDMSGKFKNEVKDFAGLEVRSRANPQATDKKIIEYLEKKGLIFSFEEYTHSYPHCWRCDSPLLNYAASSWFVKVTAIKNKIIKNNKKVHWVPEHIKEGRFGKWLEEAKDWSISRNRYWGTPLPVWRCQNQNFIAPLGASAGEQTNPPKGGKNSKSGCGHTVVVGSIDELGKLSGKKIKDLHKPVVDKIEFRCEQCGGVMKRIPEVLDCWFESGSMPYAQLHYPFVNNQEFAKSFPAEFIAEGVDQTRGWFYTLMVLATALFDKPAFLNVVVNGIVLAADGKKLSKHLKNYSEPGKIFDKYGADVVRYYLLTSPVMKAEDLKFSEKEVLELQRKVFMLLENILSFYKLVRTPFRGGGQDSKETLAKASKNILDHWILVRLSELISEITKQLNNYDLIKAGLPLEKFINDLSTWYLRRSRERLKAGDVSGVTTLGYVLLTLSKLMAPFTPFMAEHVYSQVQSPRFRPRCNGDFGGQAPSKVKSQFKESVHLEEWPEQKSKVKSQKSKVILEKMAEVRKIVEQGLAARAAAGIKVRQPLNKLKVQSPAGHSTGQEFKADDDYAQLIKEELNVKEVEFVIETSSGEIELDTNITDELKREGLAREIIRQVNNLRKEQGLTISDKVVIYHDGKMKDVFEKFGHEIMKATLAVAIKQADAGETIKIDGREVRLGIKSHNT